MIDRQLIQILSQYPEIKLAILFGSHAHGNTTRESDIDLALLADVPIENTFKLQLIEAIATQFGCPVDILDLFYPAEPILGQVLKGKRLLGDNHTYANLLTTHLFNAADFLPLHQRILTERRNAWIN